MSCSNSDNSYGAFCPNILFSLRSMLWSLIDTESTILTAYQFSLIIVRAYSHLGNSPIYCITTINLHYQLHVGLCGGITKNATIS